jgi:hypothetical protein
LTGSQQLCATAFSLRQKIDTQRGGGTYNRLEM